MSGTVASGSCQCYGPESATGVEGLTGDGEWNGGRAQVKGFPGCLLKIRARMGCLTWSACSKCRNRSLWSTGMNKMPFLQQAASNPARWHQHPWRASLTHLPATAPQGRIPGVSLLHPDPCSGSGSTGEQPGLPGGRLPGFRPEDPLRSSTHHADHQHHHDQGQAAGRGAAGQSGSLARKGTFPSGPHNRLPRLAGLTGPYLPEGKAEVPRNTGTYQASFLERGRAGIGRLLALRPISFHG